MQLWSSTAQALELMCSRHAWASAGGCARGIARLCLGSTCCPTFSLAAVFCSNLQLVDSPWLASWPMLRGIQLRNAASLDGALAWRRQAQLHGKVRDFLSERRRHHFPSGLFGTWSFIWLSDTGCTHVAEVRGIKNTLKRRYLNSNEFGLGEHFYITFLSLTALSLARGHFPITQGIIDLFFETSPTQQPPPARGRVPRY